jgi:asparagine synthase (glutamine-hydrolysing)
LKDLNVNDDRIIRNISYKEISDLRNSANNNHHQNNAVIPSSMDIESAIRQSIKTKVEASKAKRISIAISSGVDSNAIFCLARKEFPDIDIECLNVIFDDDLSEAREAEEFAKSKDAGFHEIHVENPLKDLPLLLSIVKEPRWNVYQYYFIEKARTFSKVLLTGDGGDELFAGYTFRYKRFLTEYKSEHSWLEKVYNYLLCHERDWVPDQEEMFGQAIQFSWSSIYHIIKKFFDNNLDPLEQVLLADYHGKLMYDFVPTNQKFFKHLDVVGIAPLLSEEIISLSMKIPAYLKYDAARNIGKIQLREIVKRYQRYSDENTKTGFGIDLIQFWSKTAKEMVVSYLDGARIFEDKIISKEWYDKSLTRIRDNHSAARYISKMLQLFSLEIWYKLFVTLEIKGGHTI